MAAPLRDILLKLCKRQDLTREQSRAAFEHIMSGEATEALIGGLLIGLAAKGSTVDELVGAATVMREKAMPVPCGGGEVVIDTCGTGGDVKGTFNISTTAALITAAAGVKVVKHGNRSASSKSGSADVLEKLGLRLDVTTEKLSTCLSTANICFAFARSHHPAMKHVAAARSSLGIPTLFNVLGPLTNPANARHQLLGVFSPELTERLAMALMELGSQRAWVVHAEDGLDEISTMSPTRISELKDGKVSTWKLDSQNLGVPRAQLFDLQVGSVDEAAQAIRSVLSGDSGPRRDIALLNSAAALVIAGKAESLEDGLHQSAIAIDSGAASHALASIIAVSCS